MKNFLLMFVLFLLSACITNNTASYCIKIKTNIAQEIDLRKYDKCYIESKKNFKSIEGKQVYSLLLKTLKRKGINIEENKKSANCIIFVDYGTEIKNYISNEAVWGNTGYSSSQSHYNSLTNTINTTYTPSYGIVGYAPVSKNVQLHYLAMNAIAKNGDEIWNTIAVYDDWSFDDIIPVLANVSANYIGDKVDMYICFDSIEYNLINNDRADEVNYNGPTLLNDLSNDKVKNEKQIAKWNVYAGEHLQRTLNRWCSRVGWNLSYNVNKKIYTDRTIPLKGSFIDVIKYLINSKGNSIEGIIRVKEKIIEIKSVDN